MDSSHFTEKKRQPNNGLHSGFGRLIAETLARKGYYVFATMRAAEDRNANVAHELRTLAERESLHLHVLELDVTAGDMDQKDRFPACASGEEWLDSCGPRREIRVSGQRSPVALALIEKTKPVTRL